MYGISVVIPTYNRQNDVIRAIKSVQEQTVKPIETIVVDDGSTDQTINYLNRLTGNIRLICLPHTGLPAVARNAGIRSSIGDFIAFLDSDDCWLPDKLEHQLNLMQLNPSLGLVCSNAKIDTPDQELHTRYYHATDRKLAPPLFQQLIMDNFVITSTVLLRRDALDEVGLFSEQPELCALEDYELWLRIASRREIAYSTMASARYKIKSFNNLRDTRKQTEHALGMAIVFQNLYDFLKLNEVSHPDMDQILEERIFHFRVKHLLYEWQLDHPTQSFIDAGQLIWNYNFRFFRWVWSKILRKMNIQKRT